MDAVSILKPVTKYSVTVGAANQVSEVMANAFRAAESGRHGAAYVNLPKDVMATSCAHDPLPLPTFAGLGIIETVFLEYADFVRLDAWIVILDGLLPALQFPDANSELRVYAALVGAILQRLGNPPAMQAYVEHTFALIGEANSANLKIAAATHLLRYGVLVGCMAIAKRALTVVHPLLAEPDVTSLRKGLCEQFVAWYYVNAGQEDQARDMIKRIEYRVQEDALFELRRFAAITGYWLEMSIFPFVASTTRNSPP